VRAIYHPYLTQSSAFLRLTRLTSISNIHRIIHRKVKARGPRPAPRAEEPRESRGKSFRINRVSEEVSRSEAHVPAAQ